MRPWGLMLNFIPFGWSAVLKYQHLGVDIKSKNNEQRIKSHYIVLNVHSGKPGLLVKCNPPPGGGTPYNGLYGEAPPERGTFLRLQVYKRVGISQVEVNKRVGKSII